MQTMDNGKSSSLTNIDDFEQILASQLFECFQKMKEREKRKRKRKKAGAEGRKEGRS